VTPLQLGEACSRIRGTLVRLGFSEVVLSAFDRYTTSYPGAWPPFPEGQLRFNTEPEIWAARTKVDAFYSITPLFRKEAAYNLLRRPSFTIADFYLRGDKERISEIFKYLILDLSCGGFLENLASLPFSRTTYSVSIDGPSESSAYSRFVVTEGYQPETSFFEMDQAGKSTRSEIFVQTELGFLEIAALGIVGRNENPLYVLEPALQEAEYPTDLWGCGIGVERLLLADAIIGSTINGRR
jgi:hypothetical protein